MIFFNEVGKIKTPNIKRMIRVNTKILREIYNQELQYRQTQLHHKVSPPEQNPTLLTTTPQTTSQEKAQK